jgi:hypothetical protein
MQVTHSYLIRHKNYMAIKLHRVRLTKCVVATMDQRSHDYTVKLQQILAGNCP